MVFIAILYNTFRIKIKDKRLTISPISQSIHNPSIYPQHITEFCNNNQLYD